MPGEAVLPVGRPGERTRALRAPVGTRRPRRSRGPVGRGCSPRRGWHRSITSERQRRRHGHARTDVDSDSCCMADRWVRLLTDLLTYGPARGVIHRHSATRPNRKPHVRGTFWHGPTLAGTGFLQLVNSRSQVRLLSRAQKKQSRTRHLSLSCGLSRRPAPGPPPRSEGR